MGLSDRDYSRRTEPGFYLTAPTSATAQLMLITAAFYLAQLAVPQVTAALSLHSDWWRRPWEAYQLLSYGFLHDPHDIKHIVINMLVFWMFGRELEQRYGRGEFVTFYLTAIVFAGVMWSLIETALGSTDAHGMQLMISPTGQLQAVPSPLPTVLGASGGIAGVVALFALNFPHRKVLFMFILPMPMWVAALIGVGFDAVGSMDRSGNVACTAHLAGAAFGLAYYWFHWRLAPWVSRGHGWITSRSKPRLRVHEPDEPEETDDLTRQVDSILEKIQQHGQASLTRNERDLLERASRRYQQKRR